MRRARLIAAGALLVAAAGLTGLSGAAMTGSVEETPSVFAGGTLDLDVTQAGTSRLDATNMRPGQQRRAILKLRNAGSVAATLTAAARDRVDEPASAALSAVLELRLEDCGASEACAQPSLKYTGSLHDFTTAGLGTAAAGASRYVRVSLLWDAAKNDPARQGASATATLVWSAVAGSAK